MANNLLPVRAGEFARAYAAQQQLPVRFSTALASVGVERVLDGLLLVGLMMLAIASPTFPDRKSTRLNSSHSQISYAVFCLKKKKKKTKTKRYTYTLLQTIHNNL